MHSLYCLTTVFFIFIGNSLGRITLNNIVSSNVVVYSLRQKFVGNIINSDRMMNHFEHTNHIVPSDVFYFGLFTGSILLYLNDEKFKFKYRKLQNSLNLPLSKVNREVEICITVVSLLISKDVGGCR
jgi:hypothetical protein